MATIALARRLMGVVWSILRAGVSFREAEGVQLAERKRRRYEAEVRRLRKVRLEYGTEAFRVLVREALRAAGTLDMVSSSRHHS